MNVCCLGGLIAENRKTWQATIALPRKPAEIRLNGKAVPFHWDEERREAKTV